MRKQVINFKISEVKQRNHYMLYAEDSPFKPKKVSRKDGYKRKPKFVNRDADWQ
jgi:hypothetical protein